MTNDCENKDSLSKFSEKEMAAVGLKAMRIAKNSGATEATSLVAQATAIGVIVANDVVKSK